MDSRERELIQILWHDGRLSRWELHEKSGHSPNAVGNTVGRLIKNGLLRECSAEPSGGGRPRIPLEIDPDNRHVTGLMIMPGIIEVARLNLYGKLIGEPDRRQIDDPQEIVQAAATLLQDSTDPRTLGIGVSVTGLVDPETHSILQSSALPGQRAVSLQPVYATAGETPLVLANDVQALAARWLLTHRAEMNQDILLVAFGDGHMGATMLIQGHANKGCVMACNELGHMRLAVDTDGCYCGQVGCIERICSSPFLHRHGAHPGETIRSQLLTPSPHAALAKMIDLLAIGIANCVNFVRPHRVVLVTELAALGAFHESLVYGIRSALLTELAERVKIEKWEQPSFASAETAGWAAMMNLYAGQTH